MPNITLDPLPTQYDFITCEDQYAAFVAGLGAGKSRAASEWLLIGALQWPEARHFIFSSTFSQLKSGTMQTFFETCRRMGFRYVDRIRDKVVYLPDIGCKIEVWTSDDPELFRSLEIDHGWVDEAHLWSRHAYEVLIGRLRGSDHTRRVHPDLKLQLRLTANPPHTTDHWLVELTTTPSERTGKPPITLFQSSTFDNYMLPGAYVDGLKEQYDPELARIELGGEYGDIGKGRVWRMFQRQKHLLSPAQALERKLPPLEWDPHLPVGWSLDMNVDPMCSVLFQWHPVDVPGYQRIVMYVLDEIRVRHSVVDKVVDEFLTREAAAIARKNHQLLMYGDATGQTQTNRQTGNSDFFAVRRRLAEAGFVGETRIPQANPALRDRFAAGNGKLENYKGQIGVVIHERCKYLAKDLNQTFYKPGTNQQLVVSVEDGATTTHLGDAWSYAVYQEWPIRDVPRQGVVSLVR